MIMASGFSLSVPQRRKRVFAAKAPPFPVPVESQTDRKAGGDWWYYTAYIIDGRILVKHSGDVEQLYKMGFFGKGTLSRHRPHYAHSQAVVRRNDPETGQQKVLKITRRRQYLSHSAWARSDICPDDPQDDLPVPKKKQKSDDNHTETCAPETRRQEKTTLEPSGENEYSDLPKGDDVIKAAAEPDWPMQDGGNTEDPWAMETAEDPWENPDEKETAEFWSVETETKIENDEQRSAQSARLEIGNPESNSVVQSIEEFDLPQNAYPKKSSPDKRTHSVKTNDELCHTNLDGDENSENSQKSISELTSQDYTDTEKSESQTFGETQILSYKTSTKEIETVAAENCDENKLNVPTETGQSISEIELQQADDLHFNVDPRSWSDQEDADLLVVDDTDESDVDSALDVRKPWRSAVKKEPFGMSEALQLSPEEAFFLSYALGCLVVYDEQNVPLNLCSLWQRFSKRDPRFLSRYAVYHNFRSKGWVPKSGMKYGSDFVVYKQGPTHYHSTYSVIVRQVSESRLRQEDSVTRRGDTWTTLAAVNRTTEQVSKEVMLCYVIEPTDWTETEKETPKCLSRLKIQEIVIRRWASKQERENAEYVLIP